MATFVFKAILLASFAATLVSADIGNLTVGLRPHLSNTAEIYYTGSAGYTAATTRWSASIKPGFDAIVKVATEEDVQAAVSSHSRHL
jgi:hypothetical protein